MRPELIDNDDIVLYDIEEMADDQIVEVIGHESFYRSWNIIHVRLMQEGLRSITEEGMYET